MPKNQLKSRGRLIRIAALTIALLMLPIASPADENGINRFAIRNCTDLKILACAYDKTDNILAIPYHAKRIKPGEKERFSCGSSNRCKVFMGMSKDKLEEVLDSATNTYIVGSVGAGAAQAGLIVGGGSAATMYLIGAAEVGLAGAVGMSVAGAALMAGVGVGSVFAVVETIDGINAGKTCKKMMRDQRKAIDKIEDPELRKKARDSLKEKLEGRWPKYKNYTVQANDGVMRFIEGDKKCR